MTNDEGMTKIPKSENDATRGFVIWEFFRHSTFRDSSLLEGKSRNKSPVTHLRIMMRQFVP